MESKVKDTLPEEIAESSTTENCRFTRSMARPSETGTCLTDLLIWKMERVIGLTNKVLIFIYLFSCYNRWSRIQRRWQVSSLLICFPHYSWWIYAKCFLIVFVLFHQAYAFRLKASRSSGKHHTQEETIPSEEVPHGMYIWPTVLLIIHQN